MNHTPNAQTAPDAPRRITLGLIVGWVLGILFALAAITSLIEGNFISALIMAVLAAILLPPVEHRMQKEFNFSLSRGIKIVIVIAGLVLAGMSGMPDETEGTPRAVRSTGEDATETAIPVTARELFRAYETNAIAADDQYKGKLLEVSGTIDSIGKDILDTPYVALGTDAMIFSVQCMLARSETSAAARLTPGQSITLIGRNTGKMGNIILRECSILE